MRTRLFLTLAALAVLIPLAGCRSNKCCSGPSASYARPVPCNDCALPSTLPPGSVPTNP